MQPRRRLLGRFPEDEIEGRAVTMLGSPIEERPLANDGAQHLFQADRLRAELYLVTAVELWPSSLVFDRVRDPSPSRVGETGSGAGFAVEAHTMELDHVSHSGDTQLEGTDRHATGSQNRAPQFSPWQSLIHPAVQVCALQRQRVVRPELLDMDEGALALTEDEMLQCGQGQKFVLGECQVADL
jgi:hypothetical protein